LRPMFRGTSIFITMCLCLLIHRVPAPWTEDTSVGVGKSWISITSSSGGTKLAAVVDGGHIWTSADSGNTWTQDTSVGGVKDWAQITSSDDGSKLAAVVNGGNGKIWRSTNSGSSWTEVTTTGAAKDWIAITTSSDGNKMVAAVENGNIWTSTDSGTTWTEDTSIGATKVWRSIASSHDGIKLAAVENAGYIWLSTDSGATWTQDTSIGAVKDWSSIASSSDGAKLVATVSGGNIWTSTNSGSSWTEDTSVGATSAWNSVASSDDGIRLVAVVGNGNIWTSTNSGSTWTEDLSLGGVHNWKSVASSSDGSKMAAVASTSGNIWTYSDPVVVGSGSDPIAVFGGVQREFQLPPGETITLVEAPDLLIRGCVFEGGGPWEQWFNRIVLTSPWQDRFLEIKMRENLTDVPRANISKVSRSTLQTLEITMGYGQYGSGHGSGLNIKKLKSIYDTVPLWFLGHEIVFRKMKRHYNSAVTTIGSFMRECVDVAGPSVHFWICSAPCSEYYGQQRDLSLKYAHLDMVFVEVKSYKALTGLLPELWGVQPMSEHTKSCLKEDGPQSPKLSVAGSDTAIAWAGGLGMENVTHITFDQKLTDVRVVV